MSWFGFGGKKKKKPEEEYKAKLDQLEKDERDKILAMHNK